MFERIGKRFLKDAKKNNGVFLFQLERLALHLQFSLQHFQAIEAVQLILNGFYKPIFLDDFIIERSGERTNFGERIGNQVVNFLDPSIFGLFF